MSRIVPTSYMMGSRQAGFNRKGHDRKKDGSECEETSRRDAAAGKLTPQARRALEEAAARRAAQKTSATTAERAKKEIGGREGPEPIRYGDWEVKGRVSDF